MSKFDGLDETSANELYRIAIDSRDSTLRYDIFKLLVSKGSADMQDLLLELAINPGRVPVRRAAAQALMTSFDEVAPEVVGRISAEVISNKSESVASRLLVLVALRGELHHNLSIAETLATNHKRRVLLLLAIWFLRGRDQATASRIAAMLPADHPAVTRAILGENAEFTSDMLEDLGDQLNVDQVLLFMAPPKKQAHSS